MIIYINFKKTLQLILHLFKVLSLMEIDKYVNMSIKDFVPSNSQDISIQFDELGIMKQVCQLF
jgi:hypothetical protein